MIEIIWVDDCEGDADFAVIKTPVAKFGIYSKGNVLIKAEWVLGGDDLRQPDSEFLANVQQQISRYWKASFPFSQIAMLRPDTAHRTKVLEALCSIPVGETRTYASLAADLDSSPRAVGGACRNNPFPLLIPCHRVISSSGLGGYAGETKGELTGIKQKLLKHEAARIQ